MVLAQSRVTYMQQIGQGVVAWIKVGEAVATSHIDRIVVYKLN